MGNRLFFDQEKPEIDPFFLHRAVIFVLKPNKPCTDVNSRGLSLLEGIVKLFSKGLQTGFQRPLRHIQNKQLFGFTKKKGCIEASRAVLDVCAVCKQKEATAHCNFNGLLKSLWLHRSESH